MVFEIKLKALVTNVAMPGKISPNLAHNSVNLVLTKSQFCHSHTPAAIKAPITVRIIPRGLALITTLRAAIAMRKPLATPANAVIATLTAAVPAA